MSGEMPPEETQDTAQQQQQEINWQKRYEDLRPEYDRTTAELAEWKKIKEDDEARTEWLQSLGYELDSEDEIEDEVEDEPIVQPQSDPRVDRLLEWQAQQEYERDLKKFVGNREVSDQGYKVIEALSKDGGHTPKALEQAVKTWFELAGEPEVEEQPKTKKKAPHVLASGKTATGTPNFSEMSEDDIDKWMTDRVRASMSQS